MRRILTPFHHAGSRIKLKRCKISSKSINYMCHVLRSESSAAPQRTFEPMSDLKPYVKKFELLLGSGNGLRRSVPKLVQILSLLSSSMGEIIMWLTSRVFTTTIPCPTNNTKKLISTLVLFPTWGTKTLVISELVFFYKNGQLYKQNYRLFDKVHLHRGPRLCPTTWWMACNELGNNIIEVDN